MATVTKRVWIDGKGRQKEAWRVAYTDADGQRRFVQKRTKKEADAYRIKVEGEVATGVHTPDATSITVSDAADIWLAAAAANGCDRGTLKTYGEIVSGHIKPLVSYTDINGEAKAVQMGTEKLSRLNGPKVVAFRDALLATRTHSMATKAIRHLSMILGEAEQRGLIGKNPARGVRVKKPRGEQVKLAKRAEIPPIEHLKAMIAAADRLANEDPRLPVMVRVVMLAGLRASELRGLSWEGAELRGDPAELHVSQRADRWNDIGAPKSKAGIRSIPIGPAMATMLKAWKLRCPPSPLSLMFPATRQDRRWASDRGEMGLGPIKQGTMAALLLKVQVAAGIAVDSGKKTATGLTIWKPRYDWHHLRHVAASSWLNDGIDLKRLQVWIGHENIQLTIDVYGHLITDRKKDAVLAAGAEASLLA